MIGGDESPLPLRRGPRLYLRQTEELPLPRHGRRIGLLGGSFNPAHSGHRYISLEALKRLNLHEIWWLVSPQNPLKSRDGMAPLADRVEAARQVSSHRRIRVMALEQQLHTRFTADTLKRLCNSNSHRYVWLIGADNLHQLPRWRHWRTVFEHAAIAVFDRRPYSYRALAGAAATVFATGRARDTDAKSLADMQNPAWTFVRLRPHPASSTELRRDHEGVAPTPEN